jgi:TatD DNase family protein
MPRYFDTHSHIHFSDYDDDRDEMLAKMQDEGVWTIAIGTGIETSRQVVALADTYPHVYASIGVHPNDTDEEFEKESFDALVGQKVVAVGECGLDYFRQDVTDENEKTRQKAQFERQIQFALGHKLPLMLHIRSSAGTIDAHKDAWEILNSYKQEFGDALHAHCHFFTMDTEVAKKYLELDATFGIPGVVTYKSAPELQEAVKYLPLEKMVSETDAPYAAPVPHRGKRNEPLFVQDTVHYIADLRGEDREGVRKQLVANARRIFSLE